MPSISILALALLFVLTPADRPSRQDLRAMVQGVAEPVAMSRFASESADSDTAFAPFQGTAFDIQNPSQNFFFRVPLTDTVRMNASDNYLVAYYDDANPTSTNDWRVRAAVVSPTGMIVAGPVTVADPAGTTARVFHVRAAYAGNVDRVLIVWVLRNDAGVQDVRGRVVNMDLTFSGAEFGISDQAGTNTENSPSVTYEGQANWLVVWQHVVAVGATGAATNMSVRMRRIATASGTPGGASTLVFGPGTATEMNYNPAVARLGGTGSLVAYSMAPHNAAAGEVFGRIVPTGGTAGASFPVSSGGDSFRPHVFADNTNDQFMVAYQTYTATLTVGATAIELMGEIYVRRYSAIGTPIDAAAVLLASGNNIMPQGRFVPQMIQYLVTWSSVSGGTNLQAGANCDVRAARIDTATGNVLELATLPDETIMDLYPSAGTMPGQGLVAYGTAAVAVRGCLFSVPNDGAPAPGTSGALEREHPNGDGSLNDTLCGGSIAAGGTPLLAILGMLTLTIFLRRRPAG